MMRASRIQFARISSAFVITGAVTLIACGGATEAGDNETTYRQGQVAFKLPAVPARWKSIQVTHASLSYRDDVHDASILINGRCARLDGDTPLLALTNQLLMGTTEREITAQNVEPFDSREALHSRITAKLDGVPFAFDIFVLKKDGCVYDFVYLAPANANDASAATGIDDGGGEGAPVFEHFVRKFHTLPGSGGS